MSIVDSASGPAIDGLIRLPPGVTLRSATVADVEPSTVALVLASSENGPVFDETARGVGADLGLDLALLVESESLRGDAGSVLVVPLARTARPTRLLVVGIGAGQPGDWRAAGAALARRAGAPDRLAVVAEPGDPGLRAFTEGLALGAYRAAGVLDRAAGVLDRAAGVPDPAGRPGPENGAPGNVIVLTGRADEPGAVAAVGAARAVATGVYIARDLVNMPSLVKSPEWLANRAVRIAASAGLDTTLLGPDDLSAQGFGGLCAVGEGSPRPPYLVKLEYHGPPWTSGEAGLAGSTGSAGSIGSAEPDGSPAGRFTDGHRVLVGKGITFDSGGLSLKPAVPMAGMKTDMAGAAAVLGAMTALPALNVPGRVTGLLCLAENMIGATAMRPGDVITCWGGTTVEVLNTDAEGRLVLADGLAYAAGALDADVIVDLATLTGAIAVALGRRTAGLFSSDDRLAAALSAAADSAGERVWRLPLVKEYRAAIDSPVADLANIGRALDVGGGSITAALFLREFAGRRPWAHLDIAGTARSDADDGEISRGGTGWGVRTLLTWLSSGPSQTPAA
ncbi:leucyl aminopeptidase [Frankia sp. B2]|uniref:leucyl aminopeptidase family protein n=1 Tax=Frankia sp. B2 TaxID=2541730 RepID=UPI00106B49CE|nr:M17 family metallopeptidase [Frankia sp. B2]TFE25721.1 leucyl aminopeptidase [Frankia sp. B2]